MPELLKYKQKQLWILLLTTLQKHFQKTKEEFLWLVSVHFQLRKEMLVKESTLKLKRKLTFHQKLLRSLSQVLSLLKQLTEENNFTLENNTKPNSHGFGFFMLI